MFVGSTLRIPDFSSSSPSRRTGARALRRRVHVGLNKGEAKNALAKAVFFNRLVEMRDRSFENQRSRSRSLNIAGHPKRVVQMIVPEVQLEEWPP